jgi:N-acetylornithine carbamoyltransferase
VSGSNARAPAAIDQGFHHLGELATAEVEQLVARALELRAGAKPRRFEGKALGTLFFNPSLRTQASFQRAAGKLGLDLVQLQGGAGGVWGIECEDGAVMDGANAEHVREAAAVLGRFVDVLCIRAFAGMSSLERDLRDPLIQGFRRFAGVPIVNMESALWHPCQALADWATLDLLDVPRKSKLVLTWAWHPKPLPHAVPNSTLCMAAQRGMEVVVLRPEGYDLHAGAMREARALAAANGGSVRVTADRDDALRGASAVYAKSWASLGAWGDAEQERARRAPLRDWCVGADWMERTDRARFLHCLPVRRNVVVRDEVLDGPWSVVIDQAENRLHAQTALLEGLFAALERKPRGTLRTRANPTLPLEIDR